MERIIEAMKKNKFEDLRNDATNVKEMIEMLKEMYAPDTMLRIKSGSVRYGNELKEITETPFDKIKVYSVVIENIINYYGQSLAITINI